MPPVYKTVVHPHLPSGTSNSLSSTSPPLILTPPLSIFVSLSPFVSVVPALAHIFPRSASYAPPLSDTHCPSAALFLSPLCLSSPSFGVFIFISQPPCHFSLLSSAPGLESAVLTSDGLCIAHFPKSPVPSLFSTLSSATLFVQVPQKSNQHMLSCN